MKNWVEKRLWRKYKLIGGVDEAGRGALAGPVVAAVVILKRNKYPTGTDDSKKLSPLKRRKAFLEIINEALDISVGYASNQEIDRLNIREASFLAMKRAIKGLRINPEIILVDGFEIPGLKILQKAIVKGESKSISIAAASIIAKVTRDSFMRYLSMVEGNYGFDRNKGYPTKEHRIAIFKHGQTLFHRKSFSCRT